MFKLELIWINTKENKFFESSNSFDPVKHHEFFSYYLTKHKLLDPATGDQYPQELFFKQLADGSYSMVARVSGFRSLEHVEEYYLDAAKEGKFEYPEIKRKWQQEHHIAAEVNILDLDNNIVKLLSSCHGNICVKYGSCDSNLSCNIKSGLPRTGAGKQFPIFHIKEMNL